MSSLALIIVLLLVLVASMFAAGLAYLGYRHPDWIPALTLGLLGGALFVSVFIPLGTA
ncbi:hypothetical protein [Streptomyces sp. NPDC008125]|uniref:hypothetical protein n=1 Tax=Streptomyces sp. NPDC008125 TaxID=3364811 RepID=UPI0036E6D188